MRSNRTTPASKASELGREARYFHRAFFRSEPPPEVIDRYIAANLICCAEASALVDAIVVRQLDAEAIELSLRLHKGPTILTRKIQILFYLLEVRSAYYPFFFGRGEPLPIGLFGLLYSVLQTAVKYVKGTWLVRKHGLV